MASAILRWYQKLHGGGAVAVVTPVLPANAITSNSLVAITSNATDSYITGNV